MPAVCTQKRTSAVPGCLINLTQNCVKEGYANVLILDVLRSKSLHIIKQ